MNVLIITPDAVGSTLLQRLITIYMQFHKYDRPVINLHELTNGLVKYHNQKFNQEVLGKKDGHWGYHQSLEQIVDLLESVDHYKTSRLAQYHIKKRGDSLSQQIPFYDYLNQNFYIISCRRHNVFEHALSWCLSKITKKLNVYTDQEKIESFFALYKEGIDIDPNSLIQTLETYRNYLDWCQNYFHIASYFFYEEHLPNIENYILNLAIFSGQPRLTWKDMYNTDFNTWNQYHYLKSDLGTLALENKKQFDLINDKSQLTLPLTRAQEQVLINDYYKLSDPSWPQIQTLNDLENLPLNLQQELANKYQISSSPSKPGQLCLTHALPESYQQFLQQHQDDYENTQGKLNQFVNDGIMISPPPIKKQTLAEKKHIIRNFDHCLDVYNQWITNHPQVGVPISPDTIDQFANKERLQWIPAQSTPTHILR